MKVISRFALLLIIIGGFCTNVYGDGKMYIPDRIPADIPYQRAFLVFHEGFETLILQSKYEFSQSADVNSIGWVVPVPAVPELASVDADKANYFFLWSSIKTTPNLIEIQVLLVFMFLFVLAATIVLAVVLILLHPFLNIIGMPKATWERLFRYCGRILYIGIFVLIFLFIHGLFGTAGLSQKGGIEVVKAEQVGIYDVKVIKGDSAEALVDWLKENEFSFSDKDIEVMEDYVNKKWCFVTAKVQQEQDTKKAKRKITSGGMVAPLILKFETEKAIYPLALTSVIGTKTEVLLYTLSENKLSCNQRIKLQLSRRTKTESLPLNIISYAKPGMETIFQNIPEEMTICKFKEKLTPEQMKQDIEFEDAPDNEPYRETKIVW